MIPLMRNRGYDADYAVNVTCTGAIVGLLVPPSHNMLIYSASSGMGISVGDLFLAGVVPGLLTSTCLMVVAWWVAVRRGYPSESFPGWRAFASAFVFALPGLLTGVIIMGGILSGAFTATESSAIAVWYTIFVGAFVYRTIGWRRFFEAAAASAKLTATVLLIIGAATAFGYAMAILEAPAQLAMAISSISEEPVAVLLLVNVTLLALGTFMDMGPMIVIATPIFLPVVMNVGVDPVHFGVIMMLNLGVGLVTPPVGTVLFVGAAVGRIPMQDAVRTIWPFYLALLVSLAVVTFVPSVSSLSRACSSESPPVALEGRFMIPKKRICWWVGAISLGLLGWTEPADGIVARATSAPPEWALLQRHLLEMSGEACFRFFDRYFDDRGFFLGYVRYGANDGPDDAIENLNGWPLLHALGAHDRIAELVSLAWEGHLRQFTEAREPHLEIAREAIFYREFHVQFDWQHHAEELSVFNLMGLSNPNHELNRHRIRRFAGLYMGEDPGAPNWDGKHKIIRSLMNGSRGPMLRPAKDIDWAGGPFEVAGRFVMEHGEESYEETLAHYRDYREVVGDHPLNLLSTTLALQAFLATGEVKYRKWLLEYVDAWRERAARNGDILPSNIGLDGEIGSAYGGRWWAGVYGWSFSPTDPSTGRPAHRNRVPRAILAFFNAYLLTGDDAYLETWRRQTDRINAQQRRRLGQVETPTMYGAEGWYGWRKGLNRDSSLDIWWFSQRPSDRSRVPDHPWLAFLEGRNPGWPTTALRRDIEQLRSRVRGIEQDPTTPDTRLADAVLGLNPALPTTLLHQVMGAIHIARPAWSKSSPYVGGAPLFARIRPFDPARRRTGLPEDVAVLVTGLGPRSTELEIVNLNVIEGRRLVLQGGGYGEHRVESVEVDGTRYQVDRSWFTIALEPSAHARVRLEMERYVYPPSLRFPWDRG